MTHTYHWRRCIILCTYIIYTGWTRQETVDVLVTYTNIYIIYIRVLRTDNICKYAR